MLGQAPSDIAALPASPKLLGRWMTKAGPCCLHNPASKQLPGLLFKWHYRQPPCLDWRQSLVDLESYAWPLADSHVCTRLKLPAAIRTTSCSCVLTRSRYRAVIHLPHKVRVCLHVISVERMHYIDWVASVPLESNWIVSLRGCFYG